MNKDEIKGSVTGNTILGTYEGECADSNITNKNGLDITRPVWEGVFASEEYTEAIDKGWYIGFLGHPEDPNCMDFEHACIVMTEGHIADNGKIYGKFNLIDTPVGRIVKAFQDAGVKFGISVRGAGDIIDNSVDPDTFVFRGFDLVSFPAYPESIPTFTEIAASSDVEKQKKYKAVCAAVNKNIEGLNTTESVEIVQSCFAKQSEEYKKLEKRKAELIGAEDITDVDLTDEKIEGMMNLYLNECEDNKRLVEQNAALRDELASVRATSERKFKSMQRIVADQRRQSDKEIAEIANHNKKISASYRALKAHTQEIEQSNLKYVHKIEANTSIVDQKDSVISNLQSELSETVKQAHDAKVRASNCEDQVAKLSAQIKACEAVIEEYQNAYASLYADAIGVSLDNVSVTASTSVEELQNSIRGASALPVAPAITELESDIYVDDSNSDDIISV